ncbi:anthocyanidin 5,3-O-glucosyltransferase-like protein, partial [Trifolium pratense]
KGIVVNTFRELEVVAVKAVEDGVCFLDIKRSPPPVYCIGPLIADPQQSAVEDMKVAVAVEQREGDRFVSGEEVKKRVRELMESERGTEIRERSLKFKDMARDALGEFGSSTKALANLVQTWNEINHL